MTIYKVHGDALWPEDIFGGSSMDDVYLKSEYDKEIKMVQEEKMEGYILEISHVVTRKFHIYMPDDRPYEIMVVQDELRGTSEIKAFRKMPDELINIMNPENLWIRDMIKKELEK